METRNTVLRVIRSLAIPLAIVILLFNGASAIRADAPPVNFTVSADPPTPAIIGPGDSFSDSLHSYITASQQDEENLTTTSQQWDITSVAFSSDDVNWTSLWSGSGPAAAVSQQFNLSISGGVGSAELAGTLGLGGQTGFYQVSFSTKANVSATVGGTPESGSVSTSGATSVPVAMITNIAVGAPATQTNMIQDYPNTGDINYGVVETANTNAMATATTSPATAPIENKIVWSNGTAVAGNNAQRNYSLGSSQKYTIDPTLGGHSWKGHNVYLWVIWAKVTIDDTQGAKNPGPSLVGSVGDYGGNELGLFYNANKTACDFQNCQIAHMTPSGVHNVITGGCVMVQKRQIHVFQNITQHGYYWDPGWTPDGPSSSYYTKKPDASDKVYAVDDPAAYVYGTGAIQDDEYGDFRDHMEWNGAKCSDYGYWYFQAGAKSTANPVIYFAGGGTGQITVPNTDPQGPESP